MTFRPSTSCFKIPFFALWVKIGVVKSLKNSTHTTFDFEKCAPKTRAKNAQKYAKICTKNCIFFAKLSANPKSDASDAVCAFFLLQVC